VKSQNFILKDNKAKHKTLKFIIYLAYFKSYNNQIPNIKYLQYKNRIVSPFTILLKYIVRTQCPFGFEHNVEFTEHCFNFNSLSGEDVATHTDGWGAGSGVDKNDSNVSMTYFTDFPLSIMLWFYPSQS